MDYSQVPSIDLVNKTILALSEHNISAELVETKTEAKKRVGELIPSGSEVMTMTSVSLEETGITELIDKSNAYVSLRNKLNSLDRQTQSGEMQKIGAAPEWAIGSVHAVTKDGTVVIASNTGSQLPAYSYGAQHVLWIIGTQKIVQNMDSALERINKYIVPLESLRARKAYHLPETWHTNVSKLLVIHKEVTPKRIHIVFVNEKIGF